MARLTAAQISLMKQFFAQIGAVDSSWLVGDIDVSKIDGKDNWFTALFDTRLTAQAPALETDQATDAATAAAAAQVTADQALAAVGALSFQSGSAYLAADQSITLGTLEDITGLTATFTLDLDGVILVSASVCSQLLAADSLDICLDVDGATETVYANSYSAGNTVQQLSQTWRLALAAGEHTIKVQARKAAGSPLLYKEATSFTWWQQ